MALGFESGLYAFNGDEATGPNMCSGALKRYSRDDALRDEQPTKYLVAINLKTAKPLGLTIPPSVLVHVDVIE